MYFVDRSAALIKPKQPFLDWLKSVEEKELDITLAQLQCECNMFLIPPYNTPEEAVAYIDEIYLDLFKIELSGWYEDPAVWPEDMSLQAFWEMFEISFHSMVIDTQEAEIQNDPIFAEVEDDE